MFSIIKGTLVVLTKSSIERNKSYHWFDGNTPLKTLSFGCDWSHGSISGIFITLIGTYGGAIIDGSFVWDNSCSRLS